MIKGLQKVTPLSMAAALVIAFFTAITPAPAAAATQLARADDAGLVHRVPSVPLTIDGRDVAPERILDYNGRKLYMALMPRGINDEVKLVAFTKSGDFELFVHGHGGPAHVLAKPQDKAKTAEGAITPQAYPVTTASLFEHMGMQGQELRVEYVALPNLTQIYPNCWCFWSWNDQISSLWTGGQAYLVVFEHINYDGSVLWTYPGIAQAYLEGIGWNDRISSLIAAY